MSRIGKKPIEIPIGMEVKKEGSKIIIHGPKGELSREIRPEIDIEIKEQNVYVFPNKTLEEKKQVQKIKAFWGLTRALLANMIEGVNKGYEKKLEIQGLGYKALLEENSLILNVGFSHSVKIEKPDDIEFLVEKNIITISGIDKESVGAIAAKIRKVRPPEPYKGKGIRYVGEVVRRKVGKKAATAE